ncbi:hypothetical protein HMPREF0058_1508 [Actinomyces urogenitalis DSM 15434]|uniref:Tat pathway signal sequence domain protein n=2 Tax=Actinomyces urogenitalis TaxID=103621 RepID=C0W6L4_9ACTO|nr:hypothetical protein HMPREF0058_1508 [Actinomyces urogenitalis DSM 15434]
MGLRSWCPRVLAFVLLAAGSSACGPETAEREVGADVSSMSPSDISPDGTVSVSGLTIKDYEKGSLPSYPYEGVDPRLWGYAYDLHVASCMVDRGRVAPPVQSLTGTPQRRRRFLVDGADPERLTRQGSTDTTLPPQSSVTL